MELSQWNSKVVTWQDMNGYDMIYMRFHRVTVLLEWFVACDKVNLVDREDYCFGAINIYSDTEMLSAELNSRSEVAATDSGARSSCKMASGRFLYIYKNIQNAIEVG